MTSAPSSLAVLPDWVHLPHAEPGNRIGLFGGSFNPPHSGHRMVASVALKRLGLDQVWWLVTPGNPLKVNSDLAPLEDRVRRVQKLADHPRMKVTAHEAVLGSTFTASTIMQLQQRHPSLTFVWIMGADNMASFHYWQDWRQIAENVPVAVIDRPGASLAALSSPFAQSFASSRINEQKARLLVTLTPPAWVFLHAPLDETSSTRLRQSGNSKGN